MIQVEGIKKIYCVDKERIVALGGVSLQVREGEICCILGSSGSGKSTLLNIMAGLEKPSRGKILLAGEDVTRFQSGDGRSSGRKTSVLCSNPIICCPRSLRWKM